MKSPPSHVPPTAKRARLPMCKNDGIANSIQAHFLGGTCATDTAIAEMVRSLGGDYSDCTIEDIRRVVQNCQEQNGRTQEQDVSAREVWIEEVKGTAVDEEVLPHARCPARKMPRAF